MDHIDEKLGKRISEKELAERFGLAVRFVRKYYLQFGGIKLGDRRIVFFEKEVISAVQRQKEQGQPVDRAKERRGEKDQEIISDTERGRHLGKNGRDISDLNRHGLFN